MFTTTFQATLLVLCSAVIWSGLCNGGFERPFGCQAMNINDRIREDVLNFVNDMRSYVALGVFREQNLSSASDMNKLRWDCSLEELAEAAVPDCPENPLPGTTANGMIYRFYGKNTPTYDLRNPLESAVLWWTDLEKVKWPATNVFDGSRASRDFANLIRATTTAFGCSETTCEDSASAACVFSQPDVQHGTLVYTSGSPCRNDSECTEYSPAFCESGLCVNAARTAGASPQ